MWPIVNAVGRAAVAWLVGVAWIELSWTCVAAAVVVAVAAAVVVDVAAAG